MAPNATAPEPVETEAKTPSRQPPSDSVWVRYHPWMEGAMGHLASWSIHLLIIGVAVLVSLAYAWGFIKHNHQLPVEPVQLAADAGGGGGSNEGSGEGPSGDHAPPNEGVKSEKTNEGNTEKPTDRVKLTEAERQKTAQEFPAADGQNTQRGPESMNTFRDLDKELRGKLSDSINPANGNGGTANGNGGTTNGNGGTGKDGGTGSGKDKGVGTGTGEGTGRMLNESEKRRQRWHMDFMKVNAAGLLDQLDTLGCILVVPVGPHQYKVIRDLSKPHPPLLDPDPSMAGRTIWNFDNPQKTTENLTRAMGLGFEPPLMGYSIPPALEAELAKKELEFKGLKENQISETKFEVFRVSGPKRYDVRVKEQHAK